MFVNENTSGSCELIGGDMMEVLAREDRGGIPKCHVMITVPPNLSKGVNWGRSSSKEFLRDYVFFTALWAGRAREAMLPGGLMAVVTSTKLWLGTLMGLDYAGLNISDVLSWTHHSEGRVTVTKWAKRGEEKEGEDLSVRLTNSWHPLIIARTPLGTMKALDENTGEEVEVVMTARQNYDKWGTGLMRHTTDVIATPDTHTWLGGDGLKPLGLVEGLVDLLCVDKGMNVLDPFARTGTVGVAAMEKGHRGWLIERNWERMQEITNSLKETS